MIRKLLLGILVLIAFSACDKYDQQKKISYFITDSDSGFEVYYLDKEGNISFEQVTTNSEDDEWVYSFEGEKGDIVYLSVIYYDINSKVRSRILIDNKIYKEGYSVQDTGRFMTISGTIAY